MAYLKNPDELSEVEIKVLLGTCYGVGDSAIAKMIRKSNRTVERHELVKVSTQLSKLNGYG